MSIQKIGIWGFGVVGKSILKYLVNQNNNFIIQILDKVEPESISGFSFLIESEFNIKEFISNNDQIYISPGIDILRYKNIYGDFEIKIRSELDIFSLEWQKPLIAVTGTLGKTSTVSLLSYLLKESNIKVEMGGNIGTGMLDLLDLQTTSDYAVLELSSFQLDLVSHQTNFSPDIAIFTNLYSNHLDRHLNIEDYFLAKFNILKYQKEGQKAILNWDLKQWFLDLKLNRELIFFGIKLNESDIENHLKVRPSDTVYSLDLDRSYVIKYKINGKTITDILINQLSFPINWLILHITSEILNVEFDMLNSNLSIPEHRLEYLGSCNNIKFYNDSKATVPQSTLAALDYCIDNYKYHKINLFVGGISKGINREEFIIEIKRKQVSHNFSLKLFCFGLSDAKQLYDWALQEGLDVEYYTTLEEAFDKFISSQSEKQSINHVLLFSPSGASFDLFKDYKDRGNYFKKLVDKYFQKEI